MFWTDGQCRTALSLGSGFAGLSFPPANTSQNIAVALAGDPWAANLAVAIDPAHPLRHRLLRLPRDPGPVDAGQCQADGCHDPQAGGGDHHQLAQRGQQLGARRGVAGAGGDGAGAAGRCVTVLCFDIPEV
jgi:hypothetical protein